MGVRMDDGVNFSSESRRQIVDCWREESEKCMEKRAGEKEAPQKDAQARPRE